MSHDTRAPSTTPSRWETVLLGALIGVVLLAYASLYRTLWFDEFVQFALGGMAPGEAMHAILATTGSGLNQGANGVYLFVDYWLLKAFGANLFAFRLPSLLSAAFMLFAAVTFLRLKGFGRVWQAVVVMALAANWSLMYFAGEARPYMPLAAGTIATLAYYQYPLDDRGRAGPRALGFLGIIGGALSHPYFGLMWGAIAAYSIWDRGLLASPRRWIGYLNPLLVVPAATIYVGIGLLTWAKARPDDSHDPWYYHDGLAGAWATFIRAHTAFFQPVPMPWAATILLLLAVAVALTLAAGREATLPPLVLIGMGVMTSLIITAASIRGGYWVLERQWVAGLAIVTLGAVWLLAASWGAIPPHRVWARVVVAALTGVIMAAGTLQLVTQARRTAFDHQSWSWYLGSPVADVPAGTGRSADEWVRFANQNVDKGGPVWPEMADYYTPWLAGR